MSSVKAPLEIAKQFQGLSPGNSTNFSGQNSPANNFEDEAGSRPLLKHNGGGNKSKAQMPNKKIYVLVFGIGILNLFCHFPVQQLIYSGIPLLGGENFGICH